MGTVDMISAPEVVAIPVGSFEMGATDDDKFANLIERPRHNVQITHLFAIGKFPVTFAQYDAFVEAVPEAFRPNDHGFGRGDLPVFGVSWRDAAAYCDWLTATIGPRYRLPTEAEWEYACRAGTTTVFHTGGDITPQQANYLYDELGRVIGLGRPTAVGSYPPNAFGLHDFHGNICELVQDHWHDGYSGAPADGSAWLDPADSGSQLRVIRGGSWDYLPRLLRAAYRDWIPEDQRLDNVGFRVAIDVE